MDIYVRCVVIAIVCAISLSFSGRWSAPVGVSDRQGTSAAQKSVAASIAPTALAVAVSAAER